MMDFFDPIAVWNEIHKLPQTRTLTPGAPPSLCTKLFLCEFCLMKHKPKSNHHRKAGAFPSQFWTNGIESEPRSSLRSHTVRPAHWLKIERHHLERSSKFTSARIGCSAFTDGKSIFQRGCWRLGSSVCWCLIIITLSKTKQRAFPPSSVLVKHTCTYLWYMEEDNVAGM